MSGSTGTSNDNGTIEPLVRSLFDVKDTYVMEEGSYEFKVAYKDASGKAFLKLLDQLAPLGYSAQLYGTREDATLLAIKEGPVGAALPPPPRASIFLFFLTILAIVVTGYVLALIFPQVAPGTNAILMGGGFIAALMAVLVVREATQRYAAKRGGFSRLTYFLPNLPLFIALPILYFLPTFGSITFPRTPAKNKDSLFDFYFLGSIVGIAVALAISFAAAGTNVVLTKDQLIATLGANQNATIMTNPSLLQDAALNLAQSLRMSAPVPQGGTMIFSPIEIAAWLGFLLVFFSLLPAALFDGGRMARLVLGERGSRATTMASALLLLLVDLPNYWVVFLLVFLLAAIRIQGDTLDSITETSRSRKALFVVALVVALLCIPVPQNFASFPLPLG